jgi:hypothetical protein
MKIIVTVLIVISACNSSMSQPSGNGNGGNGNNGNGTGGCADPPCGGPNSVPIEIEWLLLAGLIAGSVMKFRREKKATI